ncbi:MAG: 4-oxalomesaconate tautomerase [Pseudomonadota bacterium]
MQIRGGSSKGLYFLAKDLPRNEHDRNQVLLDIIGRDEGQINGLGGGHPLSSKIAIVSSSIHSGADVDYLFAQVIPGREVVDTAPNCGNILAGVGPFAIESGLVTPTDDRTNVSVFMVNSGRICNLTVSTPDHHVNYTGDTVIDGVPGSSAPIVCRYHDIAGSVCGSLFPTGNTVDTINGTQVSCVDNGMPVVVLAARDANVTGYESIDVLNGNNELKRFLTTLRLECAQGMGLGDVTDKAIPKMTLAASPRHGGIVHTRTFIPNTCHTSIGVLGAVSVATVCLQENSSVTRICDNVAYDATEVSIEHPSGALAVTFDRSQSGEIVSAGVVRTARLLSRGIASV